MREWVVAEGEGDRFGAFVRDCGAEAVDEARRLTQNAEEAKDLVQDALVRLAKYWERCGAPRSVPAIFLVIMRNAYFDRLRRAKNERIVSLDAVPEDCGEDASYHEAIAYPEPDLCDQLIRQEAIERVRRCLRMLTASHRKVLVLAVIGEQSYKEIAAQLEVSVGTVRSRLYRAKKSFRECAWETMQ